MPFAVIQTGEVGPSLPVTLVKVQHQKEVSTTLDILLNFFDLILSF
jgi:hypothetical protein